MNFHALPYGINQPHNILEQQHVKRFPYFSISRLKTWRWLSVIIAGLVARLLIDLIFALSDPDYPLFEAKRLPNYFYTVAFAFLILEGIRYLSRQIDRHIPWEGNFSRRFGIQAAINAVYTLFLLNAFRPTLLVLFTPDKAITLRDQLIVNLVAVALVIIVVLIDLGIFLLTRWQISVSELERFRKENAEFQLAMLKSQVNPHFLFNSLTTLSSLINHDQSKAINFVHKLSHVYRHVLENREKEVVTLREELQFLNRYMGLLSTRFGKAIEFEWEIEGELLDRLIAPLTLQLLIENAIKHNTRSQRKPLRIRLNTDRMHKLCVTNNIQLRKNVGYSSGIGLNNIKYRYRFLTEQKIEVLQNEQQFCVKIPLLEEVDSNRLKGGG